MRRRYTKFSSALTLLAIISIFPATGLAAKKTQRITFPALPEKMVGDAVFEISASANSGLQLN
jgi:hypothetical protein